MLKFLPEILKLSLAGIEPSDVRKTALVLHLYSNILAWLPTVCPEYIGITCTSTTNDDENSPLKSYIELIEGSSAFDSEANRKQLIRVEQLSASEINAQFEVLSQYMCLEWCDSLLKKFFALLEAQEVEVEGAAQSPLTGETPSMILTIMNNNDDKDDALF